MASGGAFIIQIVYRLSKIWTTRILRVGKVIVKVGPRWTLGIGLMLQELAYMALWVQVQDKSRQDADVLSK